MGNCCGISSSSNHKMQQRDHIRIEGPEEYHQEKHDEKEENNVYDDQIIKTTSTTTTSNTPFMGTPLIDVTTTTTPTMTMLPLVDPRLVSLLNFFKQLYARRKDIYNRIIPVHRQDLETIFSEMGKVQQQEKKSTKMGGMMRQRSLSVGNTNELKDERFKVKPIDSGGVIQPIKDGKGGGVSKPDGSKK